MSDQFIKPGLNRNQVELELESKEEIGDTVPTLGMDSELICMDNNGYKDPDSHSNNIHPQLEQSQNLEEHNEKNGVNKNNENSGKEIEKNTKHKTINEEENKEEKEKGKEDNKAHGLETSTSGHGKEIKEENKK